MIDKGFHFMITNDKDNIQFIQNAAIVIFHQRDCKKSQWYYYHAN